MDLTLPKETLRPSRKAIAFLKLFARNYHEVENANGDFAHMILKEG